MSQRSLDEYPMRTLDRPAPGFAVRSSPEGTVYVQSTLEFEPPLPSLIEYLKRAAELRPGTTFLAKRGPDGEWQCQACSMRRSGTSGEFRLPPSAAFRLPTRCWPMRSNATPICGRAVHAAVAGKLQAFNEERQGSGSVIARLLVLHAPPSPAHGERGVTRYRCQMSIHRKFVLVER